MNDLLNFDTKSLTAKEKQLAERIADAYKSRNTLTIADFDERDLKDDTSAYKTQYLANELKEQSTKGYKISLTSGATQALFDADSPLYGAVSETSFLSNDTELTYESLSEPLLEAELIFIAKDDLTHNDSLEELVNKVDIAPGIEVPDCRFKKWFPVLPKKFVISDSAVAGYVIYGTPGPQISVDSLATVSVNLTHNGETIQQGHASEVMDNPLNALKWLVATLHSHNLKVSKGMIISSGTLIPPIKLEKGTYVARYDHGLGDVTLHVK